MDTLRSAWQHRVAGPALRVALAYVLLVEAGVRLGFGYGLSPPGARAAIPRAVLLDGAVLGLLYALVGMGLILVYRANRIINFAQAQLGAVPAVLALLLVLRHGMSYWLAIPVVLLGGALLGGVTEVAFIRRFSRSPRMILTVVTIGVGFLLLVAEYYTKIWIGGQLDFIPYFPTPWQDVELQLGIQRFTGDHVVTLVVVGVIVAALAAFFRLTDTGIAVRAAAENADRASLLGIPVHRVSTMVWVIAGVLSAVGVFLRAPLTGLPLIGFVGPSVLLFGLAVAVMARMEKLPGALLAGMFIGIVDRASLFAARRAGLATAIMLVVVLGALLVQRGALSRAHELGASSWQAIRDHRPVPLELRGVREVVAARAALLAAVVGVVLVAPAFLDTTAVTLATQGVIFAIVGVSLVILTGWAGQISLGQFGFAGVGAAVAGGLAANHGADFFVALLAGGLTGAVVAILVGLPALRIQGLFLAVTTLAFTFTVQNFFLNRTYFDWLLPADFAFVERPVLWGRIDLQSTSEVFGRTLLPDAKFYYVALTFLGLSLLVARALRRNRSGRVLIGVRDNPRMLQAYGVNVAAARLAAFAISGFVAAVAGGLLAFEQGAVDAQTYLPERSVQLFIMVVIGGVGSLTGAMLGAAFILGVPLLPGLREIELVGFITSGLGLLVVLYFLPGGLADGAYRLRDAFLRRVAVRRGLHVPSLLEDSLADERALTDAGARIHLHAEGDEAARCPACGQPVAP